MTQNCHVTVKIAHVIATEYPGNVYEYDQACAKIRILDEALSLAMRVRQLCSSKDEDVERYRLRSLNECVLDLQVV